MNYLYILSFLLGIFFLYKSSIKDLIIHRIDIRLVLMSLISFFPYLYSISITFGILNIILLFISILLLFLEQKGYIGEDWNNILGLKLGIIDIYPIFLISGSIIILYNKLILINPLYPFLLVLPLLFILFCIFLTKNFVIYSINNLDKYFSNVNSDIFNKYFGNNINDINLEKIINFFYYNGNILNYFKFGNFKNDSKKIEKIKELRFKDIYYIKGGKSFGVPMYPCLFPTILILLGSIYIL